MIFADTPDPGPLHVGPFTAAALDTKRQQVLDDASTAGVPVETVFHVTSLDPAHGRAVRFVNHPVTGELDYLEVLVVCERDDHGEADWANGEHFAPKWVRDRVAADWTSGMFGG